MLTKRVTLTPIIERINPAVAQRLRTPAFLEIPIPIAPKIIPNIPHIQGAIDPWNDNASETIPNTKDAMPKPLPEFLEMVDCTSIGVGASCIFVITLVPQL